MKIIVRVFIALLVLVGLLLSSSGSPLAGGNPNQGKSLAQARKVLEQQLISVPGFAGIAHLEESGEIVVFLENEEAKGIVPDRCEGFPVRREVTGKFQALAVQVAEPMAPSQANQVSANRTGTVRPLIGGTSVSAYVAGQSWAGTLGMVTYDNKILSNAHVIALDLDNNFLPVETPVIQPGSYDGGTLTDQVAALASYIPIIFSNPGNPVYNYADAAIATLDSDVEGLSGWQFSETGDYQVSGTTTVSIGDTVRKSGRTTGVTEKTVNAINALVYVEYGPGKKAYFDDQILVYQPFSGSGDSGSVVDKGGEFVGLVFAGSASYSIVCKASYIIEGLGISVAPPGYTFTAPDPIALGDMAPGQAKTGNSTGSLAGSHSAGYIVTGIDAKTESKGYMVSGGSVLSNKLLIGPADDNLDPADVVQTFLDVDAAGTYSLPFYISQLVAYTDAVAEGYTITITFTVFEK